MRLWVDRLRASRRLLPAACAGVWLLGLALRIAPLGLNRFHEDEALYSYWGLQIATGADPLLSHLPVDKPPLFPYVLALSFLTINSSEVAARLPSLLASALALLLAARSAGRLYGAPAGLVALLVLALNPFDIAFAGTAFTDPLLVLLVLAALALALERRPGLAGLLLGLACEAKQQGILFLPLVAGAAWLAGAFERRAAGRSRARFGRHCHAERREASPGTETLRGPFASLRALAQGDMLTKTAGGVDPVRGRGRGAGLGGELAIHGVDSAPRALRLGSGQPAAGSGAGAPAGRGIAGLALGIAPAFVWDALRVQRPGFLAQSLLSYGGLHLAPAGTLGERGAEWLALVGRLAGGPALGVVLLGLLAYVLAADIALLRGRAAVDEVRRARVDVLFVGFGVLFVVGHCLLDFNTWDRYLLGLVPLLAMLAGRAATLLSRPPLRSEAAKRLGPALAGMAVVGLVLLAAGPARLAAAGGYPAGGDRGAYQGIDRVAAYVRASVPAGATVHQRWLGWHFLYYMYGYPQHFLWYRTPAELAAQAARRPGEAQWVVYPEWRDRSEDEAALATAGLALREVYQTVRTDGTVSFRVYEILPRPAATGEGR